LESWNPTATTTAVVGGFIARVVTRISNVAAAPSAGDRIDVRGFEESDPVVVAQLVIPRQACRPNPVVEVMGLCSNPSWAAELG
jgi:hypothetical protein